MNDKVIDQLGIIREMGPCNMLDKPCLLRVARELEFEELEEFIERADNREFYDHLEEMGSRA